MGIKKKNKGQGGKIVDIWEQLDYLITNEKFATIKFIQFCEKIKRREKLNRRVKLISISSIAAIFLLMFTLYLNQRINVEESVVFNFEANEIKAIDSKVTLEVGGVSYDIDSKSAILSYNESDISVISGEGKNVRQVDKKEILVLKVPKGHQFEMTLSDGTKVWLNSSSTLVYPAKFENGTRRVKIVGEAFFEVTKDEKSPFIVSVNDNYDIKVLGTSFNVDSYEGEEITKTTLVSGKVKVIFKESGQEVELRPSEQLYCRENDCIIQKVDTESFTSWKDEVFVFNNSKLSEIARSMSRCYGIDIIINDKFKDYEFSGRVGYGRGVEYFINVLKITEEIKCEFINGALYVGVID